MPVPKHVVDALESVAAVFFTNVRHQHRASFILCDGLVEITCREKVKPTVKRLGKIDFLQLLRMKVVGLDPDISDLGKAVWEHHVLRNHLHHDNPGAGVDAARCAAAIRDAVKVIEFLFPDSQRTFPECLQVTLRIIKLFESDTEERFRTSFMQAMRQHSWRVGTGKARPPKQHEFIIALGEPAYWGLAIASDLTAVYVMLEDVGAPK